MNRKFLITQLQDGVLTALIHDNKPVELSYTPGEGKTALGNIYVGKVANVVKNIKAAFVEIEDRIPCYFSLEEEAPVFYTGKTNSRSLVQGDELLVQVSKEAVKTKAPSVTSKISLAGKYLVLTYGNTRIGVSGKIDSSKRGLLQDIMAPFVQENYGWIIRTNAEHISREEIEEEARYLSSRFEKLLERGKHSPARTCLYRVPPEYLLQLRNLNEGDYDEILTDSPALYEAIREYLLDRQPEDISKLALYKDHLLPLYKCYSLETGLSDALKERVWLKSGGYLVIQPTEALTVVDVNTGKFDGKKKLRDTFLKINLEAAAETARQLRLRNLSGIVIVDFINMEKKEDCNRVMQELSACLGKDPIKAVAVDMTPLGLVEITRKRQRKSLRESMEHVNLNPSLWGEKKDENPSKKQLT